MSERLLPSHWSKVCQAAFRTPYYGHVLWWHTQFPAFVQVRLVSLQRNEEEDHSDLMLMLEHHICSRESHIQLCPPLAS